MLTAYALFGKGAAKSSSPGAIIIHFFGGIHEIYFPYVLMNPLTILALIAGGLSADAVFVAAHAGLLATPSPGSIFAEIAMSPKGGLLPVLAGIGVGALVSFAVAAPIVPAPKAMSRCPADWHRQNPRWRHSLEPFFSCARPEWVPPSWGNPF